MVERKARRGSLAVASSIRPCEGGGRGTGIPASSVVTRLTTHP